MLFSRALRLVFEAMLLFRNLGCARPSKSHYKNICDSVDLESFCVDSFMHYIYNVLKENYMLVNFIFSLRSFVVLEKSALKKSDVLVWCSAQH